MQVRDRVTIDQVVAMLNELLNLDPVGVSNLIETRVPCNQKLADHPTVQVRSLADGGFQVGLLGILNGFFGVDANLRGAIAFEIEPNGMVQRFIRL